MNLKKIFMLLSIGMAMTTTGFANDKVESTYNAKQYQNVCKGKSEGADVSFPFKGIIWNGTCQTQFFPSNTSGIKGTEEQLNSSCKTDLEVKSVNIEGKEYKGKCALGYAPPMPKA